MNILDTQVFLAIDQILHAVVGLENELSKGPCMRQAGHACGLHAYGKEWERSCGKGVVE